MKLELYVIFEFLEKIALSGKSMFQYCETCHQKNGVRKPRVVRRIYEMNYDGKACKDKTQIQEQSKKSWQASLVYV